MKHYTVPDSVIIIEVIYGLKLIMCRLCYCGRYETNFVGGMFINTRYYTNFLLFD